MLNSAAEQLADGCDKLLWRVDKSELVTLMTCYDKELDWWLRSTGCAEENTVVLRLEQLVSVAPTNPSDLQCARSGTHRLLHHF